MRFIASSGNMSSYSAVCAKMALTESVTKCNQYLMFTKKIIRQGSEL